VPPTTLAVVDLGSNSFRLQIGRVEGDQIYQLDTWRETLRMGAGLDAKGRLKPAAMRTALECLARFRERLSGLHPSAVRVVATNTFRVAKNAREFLARAERTIGFPIDVISGHEEARLTYFGVAHELPRSLEPRLVIDIGGGSTELIIGRGLQAERLESLTIGCVGMTQRFFGDGTITESAMRAAETVARVEIEAVARNFGPGLWREAYASSGTAMALADILEQNAFSAGGITPEGLARLRHRMLSAGEVSHLRLQALKGERAPVLAGGLAIMSVAVAELRIRRIDAVGGALRLGVLYDLLGRTFDEDSREVTVERFTERYGIDRAQASRVAKLAVALFRVASAKRARSSSSNGRRDCTSSGCRCRTPAFTSTAHTFYKTPTCRDSRPASRAGSHSSSTAVAAVSRRSPAGSTIPRFAPSFSRCASRSSSITRARRSPCRASGSNRRGASALQCRAAGSPRIRSPTTCSGANASNGRNRGTRGRSGFGSAWPPYVALGRLARRGRSGQRIGQRTRSASRRKRSSSLTSAGSSPFAASPTRTRLRAIRKSVYGSGSAAV